ncbi:NAD(P)-dependent oxidoreductase (plasmid) [Sagittula sp. P11]|jgi:NAD(P)-dependent dehydrogenase (short-subunit alcohol dehydrogenase family)|uniref:SDR family oxidoreductase n=1 Tax=Sagittula sp. P11 TaxID=2009329 RepID=UPI000C2D0922|nr:SDR family oxidoreductase [Sagittula sp. P11]AUC56798.1 NAD(P)-dependent oxidoreductase [Sagittula sp. P11]
MSRSEAFPVVVTGGSRGIGAATVALLAGRGHPVVFSYASNDAAARALCDRVAEEGGHAVACKGDAAAEGAVAALFATCVDRFGAPGGVFANAGITGPACGLGDLSADDLRRVLDVNVAGTFLTAQAALRTMPDGGAIVLMSSRAGRLGGAGEWLHYAASKGAIDTLCVGLAQEAGPKGFRVNAVAPGLIETEIHAAAGRGDRLKTAGTAVPLGRTGTAEEVARTVVWLMSDDASYISGTIVDISGGR